MIDYHIHTSLCGHASGTPDQYLAAARERGLKEIGFSDHFPLGALGYIPRHKVTMEPEELAGYVAEVRRLGGLFPDLTVRLGTEVDFLPEKTAVIADRLSDHPFDYIIGSVHFLEGWDFTHPARAKEYGAKNLRDLYDAYFNLIWEACRSGLFDIIGHADIIKKFGYVLPAAEMETYYEKTARVLRQTGTCLELNTAGRDAPVNRFYPDLRCLEICFREGVPVTLGSDAHAPEQVGRYFKQAAELLRRAGYKTLTGFSRRRQISIDLE